MRILHVPFCYYPDPVGGTEVYVEGLARALQALGTDCVVAAPGTFGPGKPYTHNGIRVRRFPLSEGEPAAVLEQLYGGGDPIAADAFDCILEEEQPDIVHLHAFTRGCSLRLVRKAKARGLPVVFTYHTPTVSCQRGTLMRWGSEVCDGRQDVRRCTECTLHGLGLSKPLSQTLGALPPGVGKAAGRARLAGGPWTALRMSQLIEMRQAAFRALMAEADRVVVLCQWTRDLLLQNGVAWGKIDLCRHGLALEPDSGDVGERPPNRGRHPDGLQIVFLGRLHPTKGLDLLVRALAAEPHLKASLHIYGIAQSEAERAYANGLRAQAGGDTRITFHPPVGARDVVALLRHYDVLAAPSRCIETGPLVVLEAFAAGLPVIGSNLGGIAELVRHGVNGWLVDAGSADSWSSVLKGLCLDDSLLKRLRERIEAPRGVGAVAADMSGIYTALHN